MVGQVGQGGARERSTRQRKGEDLILLRDEQKKKKKTKKKKRTPESAGKGSVDVDSSQQAVPCLPTGLYWLLV